MNVVIDSYEFSPPHVSLVSLVRVSEPELAAKLAWLYEQRELAAARGAEAERLGREVAESMRPRPDAQAEAAKRAGDRERWLRGEGDAA